MFHFHPADPRAKEANRGGLIARKGGGGGGGTTIQKTEPWDQQKPYLIRGMDAAGGILGTPTSYYPGRTVVDMSPWTGMGLNQIAGEASYGAPELDEAMRQLGGTVQGHYLGANPQIALAQGMAEGQNLTDNPAFGFLGGMASGDMLGSNPYLDQVYDKAASGLTRNFQQTVTPQIASMFARSGTMGSSAEGQTFDRAQFDLGENLGNLATGIYGGAYESDMNRMLSAGSTLGGLYGNAVQQQLQAMGLVGQPFEQERARMMAAMGMAPALEQGRYIPGQMLQQIGGRVEQQDAAYLDDAINRWNFQQQEPLNRIANYMNLIQGNYGGTSTTSQRTGGSTFGNALGGGLSGAATGGMLGSLIPGFGTGFGALLGGGLGLLGGLF